MSSVIGQGIGLSEKWPATFVAAERGNDFERRPAPVGSEQKQVELAGGRKRERKHLDASSSQFRGVLVFQPIGILYRVFKLTLSNDVLFILQQCDDKNHESEFRK